MNVKRYNNGPLPEFLWERAYFSSHEFALYREDALLYLQWCQEQGHIVYGWEVWVPTIPGPPPLVVHCDGDFEESYYALKDTTFTEVFERYGIDLVGIVINPYVEEHSKTT